MSKLMLTIMALCFLSPFSTHAQSMESLKAKCLAEQKRARDKFNKKQDNLPIEQRKFGNPNADDMDEFVSEDCQAWNRMAEEDDLQPDPALNPPSSTDQHEEEHE